MRFKVDENLPMEIAELLRQHGHDALTVHDQGLAGASDPVVAAACRGERRAIVTLDLDFSDIRRYRPADYAGIIVLRPSVQIISVLVRLMGQVIALLGAEALDERLWIVDDHRVRIRDSSTP